MTRFGNAMLYSFQRKPDKLPQQPSKTQEKILQLEPKNPPAAPEKPVPVPGPAAPEAPEKPVLAPGQAGPEKPVLAPGPVTEGSRGKKAEIKVSTEKTGAQDSDNVKTESGGAKEVEYQEEKRSLEVAGTVENEITPENVVNDFNDEIREVVFQPGPFRKLLF